MERDNVKSTVLTVPKVKGVNITLSGKVYVLPPLPVKAFSKANASQLIDQIQAGLQANTDGKNFIVGFAPENVSALVTLVTMALQRNYPEIMESDVEDGAEDITALYDMLQYLVSQRKEMQEKMEEARKNATMALSEKRVKLN